MAALLVVAALLAAGIKAKIGAKPLPIAKIFSLNILLNLKKENALYLL
jgi:hypothetical protein